MAIDERRAGAELVQAGLSVDPVVALVADAVRPLRPPVCGRLCRLVEGVLGVREPDGLVGRVVDAVEPLEEVHAEREAVARVEAGVAEDRQVVYKRWRIPLQYCSHDAGSGSTYSHHRH